MNTNIYIYIYIYIYTCYIIYILYIYIYSNITRNILDSGHIHMYFEIELHIYIYIYIYDISSGIFVGWCPFQQFHLFLLGFKANPLILNPFRNASGKLTFNFFHFETSLLGMRVELWPSIFSILNPLGNALWECYGNAKKIFWKIKPMPANETYKYIYIYIYTCI